MHTNSCINQPSHTGACVCMDGSIYNDGVDGGYGDVMVRLGFGSTLGHVSISMCIMIVGAVWISVGSLFGVVV
jgi:hypothetical protein